MSFKPLDLSKALRAPQARHVLFAQDRAGTPEQGFALLAKVALDIPVYKVRMTRRGTFNLLRQVKIHEISPLDLVPEVTGYAAAFQRDGLTHVLVVTTGTLPEISRGRGGKDLTQFSATPADPQFDPTPVPVPKHRKRRSRR